MNAICSRKTYGIFLLAVFVYLHLATTVQSERLPQSAFDLKVSQVEVSQVHYLECFAVVLRAFEREHPKALQGIDLTIMVRDRTSTLSPTNGMVNKVELMTSDLAASRDFHGQDRNVVTAGYDNKSLRQIIDGICASLRFETLYYNGAAVVGPSELVGDRTELMRRIYSFENDPAFVAIKMPHLLRMSGTAIAFNKDELVLTVIDDWQSIIHYDDLISSIGGTVVK